MSDPLLQVYAQFFDVIAYILAIVAALFVIRLIFLAVNLIHYEYRWYKNIQAIEKELK